MSKPRALRVVYGETLARLGGELPDVVVLDADLSKSTKTAIFAKQYPERFMEMGIAEQDMVSTAAGLAAGGLTPFCSTFAIFATGRAWEQLRNSVCYPNLNGAQACYFRVCGAGPNGDDNGTVRGPCMTGSMAQWQGSCIPLSAATPTPGFCFEAGTVPEGGACDAQNDGRAPADRALQCGQGSICFDDPDDPQDPGQNFAGRGQCVRMCNPAAPACNANRTCINFGQLDDPGTRDVDETLVQGFCLNTDCNVAVNECAGGQHCRPYSLVANEGACSPPGQTAHRQPCLRHTECAEQSFCGNTGSGPICLQVCNMGAPEPGCPDGEQCVQNQGWGFGVCL